MCNITIKQIQVIFYVIENKTSMDKNISNVVHFSLHSSPIKLFNFIPSNCVQLYEGWKTGNENIWSFNLQDGHQLLCTMEMYEI
jgi:hypothetical protein